MKIYRYEKHGIALHNYHNVQKYTDREVKEEFDGLIKQAGQAVEDIEDKIRDKISKDTELIEKQIAELESQRMAIKRKVVDEFSEEVRQAKEELKATYARKEARQKETVEPVEIELDEVDYLKQSRTFENIIVTPGVKLVISNGMTNFEIVGHLKAGGGYHANQMYPTSNILARAIVQNNQVIYYANTFYSNPNDLCSTKLDLVALMYTYEKIENWTSYRYKDKQYDVMIPIFYNPKEGNYKIGYPGNIPTEAQVRKLIGKEFWMSELRDQSEKAKVMKWIMTKILKGA
jgi:hypothetical protein